MRALFLSLLLALVAPVFGAVTVTLSVPAYVDKDEPLHMVATVLDDTSPQQGTVMFLMNGGTCNTTANLVDGVATVDMQYTSAVNATVCVSAVYLGSPTLGATASAAHMVEVTDLPELVPVIQRLYGPQPYRLFRFDAVSGAGHALTMSASADRSFVTDWQTDGSALDIEVETVLGDVGDTVTVTLTVTDDVTSQFSVFEVPLLVYPMLVSEEDEYEVSENDVLEVDAEDGVIDNDAGEDKVAVLTTTTAHGTLVLDPDGSFTYTPDENWFGVDTFEYALYDVTLYSLEPVVVTITVTEFNG